MERLIPAAIATAGTVDGLMIAAGRPADVVVPLLVALAGAFALRLQGSRSRTGN